MAVKLLAEKKNAVLKDTLVSSLREMMGRDERILYLDCDLVGAIGTGALFNEFPERTFNCGIMEANMIGVASALSVAGKVPFTHTFGIFASRRVHDQVFLSGAYNKANVKMIGSDPGVTAAMNGGTHMPFEDIALMRVIPEMTIFDIADNVALAKLLPQMIETYGMMYLRMPRKNVIDYYDSETDFTIGKGNILVEGSDVTIIACGIEVAEALAAAQELKESGISARVVDMFTVKPVDRELIIDSSKKTGCIVTAENHNIIGGLGSAVAEVTAECAPCIIERVGVKDIFGEVGTQDYLAKRFNLLAEDIVVACKRVVRAK